MSATKTLGRMLTGLGVLWMGWSVVTGMFEFGGELRGLGLPFIPGLLFFLVGRALARAGSRESLPESDPARQGPRPRPQQRPRPAPIPEPETHLDSHLDEPDPAEALAGLSDLEEEILELPPPMTSEEMLAEARRRFGPRPYDDGG
jgi:hypothetical protein